MVQSLNRLSNKFTSTRLLADVDVEIEQGVVLVKFKTQVIEDELVDVKIEPADAEVIDSTDNNCTGK